VKRRSMVIPPGTATTGLVCGVESGAGKVVPGAVAMAMVQCGGACGRTE